MEELDIVDSKAPPPTLDSSSGDTDLDVDSSVLYIDLNVDTGSSLVSTDRNSQSRSPSPEDKSMSEKGETIPQEKPPVAPVAVEGSVTMNSPTQAVAKPLTPDSEEVAKAVAALLSDEEVPAEGEDICDISMSRALVVKISACVNVFASACIMLCLCV